MLGTETRPRYVLHFDGMLTLHIGGLSTSIKSMKANLLLSTCVAITGIAAPMGLSFILGPMVGATPIQSFAAGAALCSTSLGTTFTVLGTSGLVSTRLGSVLTTAAMMDDVVGLVMVQIVSSLGSSGSQSPSSISPATVIRPVLVSAAFAVVLPFACRYVLRPAMAYLVRMRRESRLMAKAALLRKNRQGTFIIHTLLLLSLVVGASFAGASVLLAAYLSGILIAWWDAECAELDSTTPDSGNETEVPDNLAENEHRSERPTASQEQGPGEEGRGTTPGREEGQRAPVKSGTTGSEVYQHYYLEAVERVLKPFFFASIGFSIPISNMFEGAILWRGIVYSVLMMIGKLLCGLWLVRFPLSPIQALKSVLSSVLSRYHAFVSSIRRRWSGNKPEASEPAGDRRHSGTQNASVSSEDSSNAPGPAGSGAPAGAPLPPVKPLSLYPAGVISFAMVSRGEIGFLISSVAESKGIFQSASESEQGATEVSELFLLVTWAIVLCTIVGPICVGLLVKRIKRLEKLRTSSTSAAAGADRGSRDVLGVWGLS